ncbi:MAG TPA: hypothetical protein VHT91_20410 [Kofleriaceae bacterium]|nr:hypothetical protein [Kofleriaceae bacterium]
MAVAMSRAQQIEQQPEQQSTAAPATERSEQTFGLPRPLYAQILQLTPDDAESLSSMLTAHPGLSGPILQVAAGHMGNAAVQRAIAITNAGSKSASGEQPAHGPLSQAELHEFLDDAPAKAPPAQAQPNKHPLSQAELHEFLDDAPAKALPAQAQPNQHPLSQAELHEFLDDPPTKAAGPKAATQVDPPSVAAARAYNHQHSDLATQFNDLTNYMCIDEHGGGDEIKDGRKLDPKLVVTWQEQHGLDADGMVGPLTVAEAKQPKAHDP